MEKLNYSPTPKVEKTIILVEGTSDIAFLNLYICKKYGFKYNMSKDMSEIKIETLSPIHIGNGSFLQEGNDYISDEDYIYVLNVAVIKLRW